VSFAAGSVVSDFVPVDVVTANVPVGANNNRAIGKTRDMTSNFLCM
jgi:hypothetical protein